MRAVRAFRYAFSLLQKTETSSGPSGFPPNPVVPCSVRATSARVFMAVGAGKVCHRPRGKADLTGRGGLPAEGGRPSTTGCRGHKSSQCASGASGSANAISPIATYSSRNF